MTAPKGFDPVDLSELDWAEVDQLYTGDATFDRVSRAARWWFVDRQTLRGWSGSEIAAGRTSVKTVERWRATTAYGQPCSLDALLAA